MIPAATGWLKTTAGVLLSQVTPASLEAPGVSHEQNAIRECRIAVRTGPDVGDAAGTVAADRNGIAQRPETPAPGELNPRLDRDSVSRTAESIFPSYQVARGNTLVTHRAGEREAS